MPRHVYDQYAPGQAVEIVFAQQGDAWQPAVVVRGEPPGVWVRTADGREWFVTNSYRIRPAAQNPSPGEEDAAG